MSHSTGLFLSIKTTSQEKKKTIPELPDYVIVITKQFVNVTSHLLINNRFVQEATQCILIKKILL